ncbi:hypothetical protein ANO14919_036700 [Xylariales sp. No.14919]|nr:hypothetical protein ANO14919_036700 [Xylariales sp. No.14919]
MMSTGAFREAGLRYATAYKVQRTASSPLQGWSLTRRVRKLRSPECTQVITQQMVPFES